MTADAADPTGPPQSLLADHPRITVARSSAEGVPRGILPVYAALSTALYAVACLAGAGMAAHFVNRAPGLTEVLRRRGIWFSANDVLHAGLITWMLFIGRRVSPRVRDLPPSCA